MDPVVAAYSATAKAPFRARFLTFIARHDAAWELAMAGLAVVYVILGFAIEDPQWAFLEPFEFVITALFVAEFGSRFLAAYDRPAYLRGHWIDVVALIPVARGLRFARLLRLLRLVRAFAGIYRAMGHVGRLAGHRGFGLLVTAWLGVMVVTSLGMYAAENGVNDAVSSPLDALWWGVVTLTTVGYGDVYPVTPEGRLAAAILMIGGVALFGAITATLTSFLLASPPRSRPPAAERLRELIDLRDAALISPTEFDAKREQVLADL